MLQQWKARAREMKHHLGAVYYASQDSRIGLFPKVVIAVALLYALSPLDLIPDFIPILGYLDDLLIIPFLIGLAIKLIPESLWKEALIQAQEHPVTLKKNWAMGIGFIALWVVVASSILFALLRSFL